MPYLEHQYTRSLSEIYEGFEYAVSLKDLRAQRGKSTVQYVLQA